MGCRIIGSKSRTHYYRAHADIADCGLFVEVNCPGWTVLLAGLAPLLFLEIDARLAVDEIFQRNGLGIRNVCSLSLGETSIVGVRDPFGALLRTGAAGNALVKVYVTGMLQYLNIKISSFPGNSLYLR